MGLHLGSCPLAWPHSHPKVGGVSGPWGMWHPCLSERRALHPWACQRSEGSPSPQPVPAESPFPTRRHSQANAPLLGKMLGAEAGRSAPSQESAGEALGFSLFWRSCWLRQPGRPPAR